MNPINVQSNKFDEGLILQDVLVGIFLVSILGATCLKIFSSSSKELFRAADSEVLEAEISRSIAAIFSAQQLSPDIFGTPLYYWRDTVEPQPDYISDHFKVLSKNQKPKDRSMLLEITETGSLLFYRYGNVNSMDFQGEIYKSSLLNELKEGHWLTISPLNILRWNGPPEKHFKNGETWRLTLLPSVSSMQILHNLNESSHSLSEIETTEHSLLIPLLDHYIIYVSLQNELRRSSLLKKDNQPLAININNITKDEEGCVIYGLRGKHSRHTSFPCRTKMKDAYLRMDALDL